MLITRFKNCSFHGNLCLSSKVCNTSSYNTADYLYAVYGAWFINVSVPDSIFWDVNIAELVPIHFQITVRNFEEVTRSYNLNNNNNDSNLIPVLEIYHLFGIFKMLSDGINKVWGNICLVLVIYRFSTSADIINGWNKIESVVVTLETKLIFLCHCAYIYIFW